MKRTLTLVAAPHSHAADSWPVVPGLVGHCDARGMGCPENDVPGPGLQPRRWPGANQGRRLAAGELGLLVLVLCTLAFARPVAAQGLLLPHHDSRVAPLPRPVPGPHPLRVQSLRVETRIQGQVAVTRVQQVFANDLHFVVDGVYFYPLPEDATFVEFATWEGEKKLRGEVLEKEEARNRYLAIVRRCWDPGLLEYAGVNLFQARVFPVPPHGEKRVELTYSQVLKADSGLTSYTFPLQSGTQANPQTIGSASVSVEMTSERGFGAIYSPTHTIDLQRQGERRARLGFELKNALPDRNFRLFYSETAAELGTSLVTYKESGEDGYFMLLVAPSPERNDTAPLQKDIVFVLDTSGSMQDRGKLDKALSAMKYAVRSLNQGDRFNILTFSTEVRRFRDGLVPAGSDTREDAVRFIERQAASGGTNIHEALKEALAAFRGGDRPRYLVFVTDGLPTVGETDIGRILQATSSANSARTRVFTLGLGYDVNTFLLDQIAARNYGHADYITPEEDLEVRLSNFVTRMAHPEMTGLELQLPGADATDIFPRPLPDVFRGSQLTILGRYSHAGTIPVTLSGTLRGQKRSLRVTADFPASATANDFLPRLWAMRKVGYLLEQIRISGENEELKSEIIRLAKRYGFVTPYTSYLAADDRDLITRGPVPVMRNLQMAAPGIGGAAPPSYEAARDAVAASVALKAMKSAEVSAPAQTGQVKQIGTKVFTLKGGVWTDETYDAARRLPVVDLIFGSEAMLQAVASDRELARFAALGKNVTVVHKGRVYRIHA